MHACWLAGLDDDLSNEEGDGAAAGEDSAAATPPAAAAAGAAGDDGHAVMMQLLGGYRAENEIDIDGENEDDPVVGCGTLHRACMCYYVCLLSMCFLYKHIKVLHSQGFCLQVGAMTGSHSYNKLMCSTLKLEVVW
jgi:hypothetical protein